MTAALVLAVAVALVVEKAGVSEVEGAGIPQGMVFKGVVGAVVVVLVLILLPQGYNEELEDEDREEANKLLLVSAEEAGLLPNNVLEDPNVDEEALLPKIELPPNVEVPPNVELPKELEVLPKLDAPPNELPPKGVDEPKVEEENPPPNAGVVDGVAPKILLLAVYPNRPEAGGRAAEPNKELVDDAVEDAEAAGVEELPKRLLEGAGAANKELDDDGVEDEEEISANTEGPVLVPKEKGEVVGAEDVPNEKEEETLLVLEGPAGAAVVLGRPFIALLVGFDLAETIFLGASGE